MFCTESMSPYIGNFQFMSIYVLQKIFVIFSLVIVNVRVTSGNAQFYVTLVMSYQFTSIKSMSPYITNFNHWVSKLFIVWQITLLILNVLVYMFYMRSMSPYIANFQCMNYCWNCSILCHVSNSISFEKYKIYANLHCRFLFIKIQCVLSYMTLHVWITAGTTQFYVMLAILYHFKSITSTSTYIADFHLLMF